MSDDEDYYMRMVCCLDFPLDSDKPAAEELREDVEASLSCRASPSWARFRRMVSTVVKDGTVITHDQRMLALLIGHAHGILWRPDGSGRGTVIRNNKTGKDTVFTGDMDECALGYAVALLVFVVVVSNKCSSIFKAEDRVGHWCLSDDDRDMYLSLMHRLLLQAITFHGLPDDLAAGVLASSAWPLRRLHVLHYSEVRGATQGTPWHFSLKPLYLTARGGFDPEGLLQPPALSAVGTLDVLVTTVDWGGVELALSLATVCSLVGHVAILLGDQHANRASTLRWLPEGLINIVGSPASLHDARERDALLQRWAPESHVLVVTSPRAALELHRRFHRPTLAYLWNFADVRSAASRDDWAALHTCARCLLLTASPLTAEAVLPRLRQLPPVARPLCLYARPAGDLLVPVALVVRQAAEMVTWWLAFITKEGYPVKFHAMPLESAPRPPDALAAVLFPWALWSTVVAELYAAEMPALVPSADYLAELPCATTAAGAVSSGVGVFAASPVTAAASQVHGFAERTRCGSLLPALTVAQDWSSVGKARMVVEFSELVRWPGYLHFASIAELFSLLRALSESNGARAAAVERMQQFNREAREEAAGWWPRALGLLLGSGADASAAALQGVLESSTPISQPGPTAPTSSPTTLLKTPTSPSSQKAGCHFPPAAPLAEDTPLKARHRRTLGLFAGLARPLRLLGLRYSLAFGTLLGAVRHGGLIPNEPDLDVHVGWSAGAPQRRSDLSERAGVMWLCRQLQALVRRVPAGRHRFLVLCSGTNSARRARAAYKDALAAGHLPLCPGAVHVFTDPWYDADWVGVYESDPVAARLVLKSPTSGLACLPHQLDVYASSGVLREYGPLCACRWEGVRAWCVSRWDAYLRAEYGGDYVTPRPPQPQDAVPCPGVDDTELAQKEPEPVGSCWQGGFQPWFCCHPRFGPAGHTECWGDGFNVQRCCDEATWGPAKVAEFHQILQFDWARRCDGRRDIYGDGRPEAWMAGVYQELIFYFAYLRAATRSNVRRHALEVAAALDPQSPFDERLRALLQRDARGRAVDAPRRVRVLDVGAGPLSLLGYAWDGVHVELVAADPLACEYSEMRSDLRLEVPAMAVPRVAEAERLVESFGAAAFDAVHCTNALDHCHDPARGLEEMLRVVRLGRPVLLQHSRNEAEKNGYTGLHQWNLDLRGGRFVLWQPGGEELDIEARLVTKGLLDPGGLEAKVMDAPYAALEGTVGNADWIEVVLWRRATVSSVRGA